MNIVALLIYWGTFIVGGAVFSLGVLGVMWAPLGAVVCGWRAKERELPVLKFAVVGGLFSLFLLLPWFYLISRMSGEQFPRHLATLSYIAVYLIWLYGLLPSYFWTYYLSMEYSPELPDYFGAEESSNLILFIYMIVIGVALWIVSLAMLLMAHHRRSDADDGSDVMLPKQEYIIPFALLFGYTALIIPTMYNLWWLVVPISLSASAWIVYLLSKQLYDMIRGRFARRLTDA